MMLLAYEDLLLHPLVMYHFVHLWADITFCHDAFVACCG